MRQPLCLCLLAIVALAALAGPHPCQASVRSVPAGSDCHGEDAAGRPPDGQLCTMACAASATLAPPLDLPVSESASLAAVAVPEPPLLLVVQPIEHVPLA